MPRLVCGPSRMAGGGDPFCGLDAVVAETETLLDYAPRGRQTRREQKFCPPGVFLYLPGWPTANVVGTGGALSSGVERATYEEW